MLQLRDIAWMRLQWKRFKQLLGGATVMVWLLCSSGILYFSPAGTETEDELPWFWIRIALLVCLILSTVVGAWLFFSARREIKKLEALGTEMRLEEARAQQERNPRRRRG